MNKFKYFVVEVLLFVVIGLAIVLVVTDAEAKPKQAAKTITLTQAEAEQCSAGGGCILISEETAAALIEYMQKLEKAAQQVSCKFKTI